MIVFVHTCSTQTSCPCELLVSWLAPPTETLKVRKRRSAIVVSIPQLIRTQSSASCWTSHNGLPHIGRGINAHTFSVVFDSVDDFGEEITVSSMICAPSTTCTWISLNINPYFSVEIAWNANNHLVNLSTSWLSSAGEHVDIWWKTSSSCVVEILNYVRIDSSIGTIASNDKEAVSTVFNTLIDWSCVELADIDSEGTESGSDEQRC